MTHSSLCAVYLPSFNCKICSCVATPSVQRTRFQVYTRCGVLGEDVYTNAILVSKWFCLFTSSFGGETKSWSYKWGNDSDVTAESRGVCLRPSFIVLRRPGWGLLIGCPEWKTGRTSDDRSHPLPDCKGWWYPSVFILFVGNVGRMINHFNLRGYK